MNFGLDQVRANRFLVQYTCHAKISNSVENFESSMVQFESIQISGLLANKHISNVESDMSLDRRFEFWV